MRSLGWTLRSKNRRLELSLGGRWYLLFTLVLGFAAIYSGNNVVFLLESLLLSSLLLSGTLSELTVINVSVQRTTGNMLANTPGEDVFLVENLSRFPLYCLEFGELRGDECEFTAFLLVLPGHAKIRVRSRQVVEERGRHKWDGVVVGTSFPFGFARKVRLLPGKGSRIVWPRAQAPGPGEFRSALSRRGELEVVSGELEQVEPWQDASRVHWPASAKLGTLMARPMRLNEPQEEIWLELCHPGPELEQRISRATGALLHKSDKLVLIQKGEHKSIKGSWRALDALALLPKEER